MRHKPNTPPPTQSPASSQSSQSPRRRPPAPLSSSPDWPPYPPAPTTHAPLTPSACPPPTAALIPEAAELERVAAFGPLAAAQHARRAHKSATVTRRVSWGLQVPGAPKRRSTLLPGEDEGEEGQDNEGEVAGDQYNHDEDHGDANGDDNADYADSYCHFAPESDEAHGDVPSDRATYGSNPSRPADWVPSADADTNSSVYSNVNPSTSSREDSPTHSPTSEEHVAMLHQRSLEDALNALDADDITSTDPHHKLDAHNLKIHEEQMAVLASTISFSPKSAAYTEPRPAGCRPLAVLWLLIMSPLYLPVLFIFRVVVPFLLHLAWSFRCLLRVIVIVGGVAFAGRPLREVAFEPFGQARDRLIELKVVSEADNLNAACRKVVETGDKLHTVVGHFFRLLVFSLWSAILAVLPPKFVLHNLRVNAEIQDQVSLRKGSALVFRIVLCLCSVLAFVLWPTLSVISLVISPVVWILAEMTMAAVRPALRVGSLMWRTIAERPFISSIVFLVAFCSVVSIVSSYDTVSV